MNFATQTSDVLMTQQRMYMEMPAAGHESASILSFEPATLKMLAPIG
jgi:hypothetical protein